MNITKELKDISRLVNLSEYDEALKKIETIKENHQINEDIYYEEALIYINLKIYGKAKKNCILGLQCNPLSSKFYSLLGIIYEHTGNYDKSYLCYNQAEGLAKINNDSLSAIRNLTSAGKLKSSVRKLSVIILAGNNYEYTKICLDGIYKFNQNIDDIIITDYNSDDGRFARLELDENVKTIISENKNALAILNDALMEIGYDRDIMILKASSVILPNSIFTLRMALYENEKNAAVSSVSNNSDNDQFLNISCSNFNDFASFASKNNITNDDLHKNVDEVEIFSTIIKGEFLLSLGLFNEKYIYERDNKLYLKIINKEYKNVVCKDSFVYRIL